MGNPNLIKNGGNVSAFAIWRWRFTKGLQKAFWTPSVHFRVQHCVWLYQHLPCEDEDSQRSAESILDIIGSLQGTAWRLVENYDLSKIDGDTAFEDLMKTLDKAFQYDARVRLPQDFDGCLSHLFRKRGETPLSFITNHDEKLRKVEEHGTKIPDEVHGWLLLKRANVTREQRQMVVTQAPKLEKLRVQVSLYLILGQDHKAARSTPWVWTAVSPCAYVAETTMGTTRASTMRAMMPTVSTMTWMTVSTTMALGGRIPDRCWCSLLWSLWCWPKWMVRLRCCWIWWSFCCLPRCEGTASGLEAVIWFLSTCCPSRPVPNSCCWSPTTCWPWKGDRRWKAKR